MKFRLDFVTNSSSSSYLIATNNNFGKDEIDCIIEKNKDVISRIAKWDNIEESELEQQIVDYFKDLYPDLTLGEWKLSVINGDNESDAVSCFIYEMGYPDTNNFMIRCCY